MKSISTFITSCFMMLSVAATAREPQVMVTISTASNIDYDIKIDGNGYNDATTISNLSRGIHTVQVYKATGKPLFGFAKRRELISTRQFTLGDNDIRMDVDNYGRLTINQNGNYNNNNSNNNTWNNNNNNNNNNRDNGHCGNGKHGHKNDNWKNGKGKKKGHYKNDDDDDAYNRNKNRRHEHGDDDGDR